MRQAIIVAGTSLIQISKYHRSASSDWLNISNTWTKATMFQHIIGSTSKSKVSSVNYRMHSMPLQGKLVNMLVNGGNI